MRHLGSVRAVLAFAGAVLLLSGCGSPEKTPAKKRPASDDPMADLDNGGGARQGAPVDQDVEIEAQDEQWRKIAEEAFKKHGLKDQEKIAQSQEWYRQAVAWKDKADFQKARELAQKAVQVWPENLDARRLLAEVNALIVGGRENFGQQSIAEKVREEIGVKLEQAQIEITNHIRNGERFYNIRQYDDAIRELEDAFFKIKHIPYEVPAMKDLQSPVEELLKRVRDSKILEESRVKELKRAEAEAEMSAHEAARRREVIEKIAHLLELSYMSLDQRKFDKAIQLCNEILTIDPHYSVALELREDATKVRHREEYYDALRMKIENWKQLTDADNEVVIPYSQTVRFPAAEEWAQISKRITEEVIKGQEEGSTEDDPDILAINRKLETMRIAMDFDDSKFDNILAYIQEYSGLNFLVDQPAREKIEDKPITFKVKDLVLRNVLKILLQQFALDYTITEEKVVLITTPDLAGGKAVLELHDVRDILVRIQDFAGPKVELVSPTAGGAGGPLTGASFSLEEPKESSVSQEQVIELIKENISPGTWEGEHTIELTPNQQLMVNHTRKTHRELREFLQRLRSYTGTMVGITARFLAAFDDFLDDVGVDIINRPSAAGFDVPGVRQTPFTSIDDPSGEIGPGFVTSENARLERYDIRAQTFHTLLTPTTGSAGQLVDPISNRLINQGGLGLQYQWIGEQALQIVMRALHKSQKATIVQAPRVTVFNTQRSHIMSITQSAYIADLEPQVTTYSVGYDPIIGILTEGIVLDVRPIVSNDRKYVTLELRPSMAELQAMRRINIQTGQGNAAPGTTILQLPWIVLQQAETTVTVPDRGTLMISGFKDIVMRDVQSGVPILENIPILNFFFSRKGQSNEKRRLMILVTPEIIDLAEHESRHF